MEQNRYKQFRLSLLLTSVFFISSMIVLTSCGGKKHSVRQMREGRTSVVVKRTEAAMTEPLFYQSKKVSINLPSGFGSGIGGGAVVREQVTYVNPDNHSELFDTQEEDGEKVYNLREVAVEARSIFTPERDGKIDVDFVVRVPKDVIYTDWMIEMQPVASYMDTTLQLSSLVVKGESIAQRQRDDYQAYIDYLESIVPTKEYANHFLDVHNVARDIKERQGVYYQIYNSDWTIQKEYEEWLFKETEVQDKAKAEVKGEILEIRSKHKRKHLSDAMKYIAMGEDTIGMSASYDMQFFKKSASLQKKLDDLNSEELRVPKKYKEIHEASLRAKDIQNMTMSFKDSVDIAQNWYDYSKISDNEMRFSRKDAVKDEMLPFPFAEGARLDTIVAEGTDFVYYYKQSLPVIPGMKSVSIDMDVKVTAIDQSRYDMGTTNPLSFMISSIAQLVDTTLLDKETVKNKYLNNKQTAYIRFKPGTWKLDPKYMNNTEELAKIVTDYETVRESKSYEIDSLILQLGTSLEGEFNKNAELSMKRVEDLKKYLVKNTKVGKERGADFFKTNYIGEDWRGLVRYLKTRDDIQNKDAILSILSNASDPEHVKQEIAEMYQEDFKIIKDSIYPKLERVDMLFYIQRLDMDQATEIIRVSDDYVEGIRLLQNREYDEALKILVNYPSDYNTAVCLAALGYNGKAYEVLAKVKDVTANTEYMSAITSWRIGQEDVAIEHLVRSVEMDEQKIYRIGLDADIKDMVEKYNLEERLNQIHNTF